MPRLEVQKAPRATSPNITGGFSCLALHQDPRNTAPDMYRYSHRDTSHDVLGKTNISVSRSRTANVFWISRGNDLTFLVLVLVLAPVVLLLLRRRTGTPFWFSRQSFASASPRTGKLRHGTCTSRYRTRQPRRIPGDSGRPQKSGWLTKRATYGKGLPPVVFARPLPPFSKISS